MQSLFRSIILFLSITGIAFNVLPMKREGEEPVSKKSKFAPQSRGCVMLMDAYENKTKSEYYKSNTTPCNWEDDQGTDPLERALNRGDMQECINLVAKGHLLEQELSGRRLIHVAATVGAYSFCEFLVHVGVYINCQTLALPVDSTPLLLSAAHGHSDISKLLLENGAQAIVNRADVTWKMFDHLEKCKNLSLSDLLHMSKILATQRNARLAANRNSTAQETLMNEVEQWRVFDAFALRATLERFHELFPVCMELGADLVTLDNDGRPPLLRIPYNYSMKETSLEAYAQAIINITTAYQIHLERKELKTIFETLLVHNRKTTALSMVPKDVLRNCILSRLVPYHAKHINYCVDAQCSLLQTLLTESMPTPASLSIAKLTDGRAPKVQEVLDLFDSFRVKQHRKALEASTRKLMNFVLQETPNLSLC